MGINMCTVANHLDPSTPDGFPFYRQALEVLLASKIPFLVGGGYAIHAHTNIARMTKDLDVFILPNDVPQALLALDACGFRTEVTYSHWLAKAYSEHEFIDIIFNSGNGCCPVDQEWFDHGTEATVMGHVVRVCPPEEAIWQKAFIMERERYDGADIAHLLRICGATMDWDRLVRRFDEKWRVLLSHLILFGFIYPCDRGIIPDRIMIDLLGRLQAEMKSPSDTSPICFGTLLSREQYLIDVQQAGYRDARLQPPGTLTADQIARWTPNSGAEAQ